MIEYKYKLEPYKGLKTRYPCPNCGHNKSYTRYIETDSGEHLAEHVGRCNRESNCGYHYPPKQYFSDNIHLKKKLAETQQPKRRYQIRLLYLIYHPNYLKEVSRIMKKTISHYIFRSFSEKKLPIN